MIDPKLMKRIQNIKKARIRRFLLKTVLGLYLVFVLLVFYVVTLSVLSSFRYASTFPRTEGDDAGDASPEMTDLRSKRSFLEARMGLVSTDSVSLTVDLADSLVTIEQNGVVLHTARIQSSSVSRVFGRMERKDVMAALAAPLTVKDSYSTIDRKRYTLKVASADSVGAAPMVTPDTSSRETVCFRLGLDMGIQLDIRQAETAEKDTLRRYKRAINHHDTWRIMNDLLAFRIPDYHPVIQVQIPEQDARVIYRALPVHARIALRI